MSESKIEKELIKVSKFKLRPKEERVTHLTRLMKAVSKLNDDLWNELTPEAQEWTNNAAQAHKDGSSIADFSNVEEPEEEIDEETGEVTAKDEEVDEEQEEEKPAKPVKSSPNRRMSACHMIKMFVCKQPGISIQEISDKLKDKGVKVTGTTISSMRSDTRDTLRVLNEMGMGEFKL